MREYGCEAQLIAVASRLNMSYKPRGGEQQTYEAIIRQDGWLEVEGTTFSRPSYAALHGITLARSTRTTVNGWTSWKDANGVLLKDIRGQYLQISQR